MKNILLATTVLFAAASAASAFELGNTGVSLGGEVDFNYTTGVETTAMDITSSASFAKWGVFFGAETTFDLLDVDEVDDLFTGIDFDAAYAYGALEVYGEVSTDADFEFGDVTIGTRLSF
jgi:hypothetical protein